MYIHKKKLSADLNIFLGIIISLIIIGLLFIYSSSSVYAVEKFGIGHYFVKKQLIGLCLGIIGLLFFRWVPLETIKTLSPGLFLVSLGLTALTLTPFLSERIHGSSRWLYFKGLSFQPSELLKISLIIYLAYFLSRKESRSYSFVHTFLPLLAILAIPSILLLKQPDFGMTVTIVTAAFLLFFIMHFQLKHLLISLLTLLPICSLLIYMQPYRWKRILTFLDPWNDPQGAGFQIIQSLIAIGSGSFWGTGVAHSKQKYFYLPMQHTDFIFSIIAEETGFVGSFLLVTLYMLFLYIGIRIAWQLKDRFCSLVTLGFVFMINLQAIMNLAVATGLVPTKGIGLPFVSYGNSALICSLCMVGLIINCVYDA